MKRLKLYGLPRSATTVAKWLIEKNLEVSVLASVGGSKHGPCCLMELDIEVDGVVIVTKNPYAWLWSLFRWASSGSGKRRKYGCPKAFPTMLRRPIISPNPGYRDRYPNPVVWWNMMNYHWMSIKHERVAVLRHEDIVQTPVKAIDAIAKAFGATRKPGAFTVCEHDVRAGQGPKDEGGDWPLHKCAKKFAREFYRKKNYLTPFSAKDFKHVNAWLDKDLLVKVGYRLEKKK